MKGIEVVIWGAIVCLLTVGGPAQAGLSEVRKPPEVKQTPLSPLGAGIRQPPPGDSLSSPSAVCRPDISSMGPLGCYDPGKILISLSGKCFGPQPGPFFLAVQAKGSPTIHRFQAESWSETQIRFRLPNVPDLKPSTQADLGIVNAQNQWLDKQWITTCTKEGTMPHYPPSSPGNVQVK